jgi:hypothetical protein
MFLFAMLIDAFHAAFENAVIAFDGIGVDVAANVFLLTVVDGFRGWQTPRQPQDIGGLRRSSTPFLLQYWRERSAQFEQR